jgi:hypothetical protein
LVGRRHVIGARDAGVEIRCSDSGESREGKTGNAHDLPLLRSAFIDV